ncbi:MAG: endonuclease [Anaerolineae bacterium]|nr:endonuclease [Anaerolineae bacterium]
MIIGIVIGAAITVVVLRAQDSGLHQALRAEIAEAYKSRLDAERARLIQQYEARIHDLEAEHTVELSYVQHQGVAQSRAVLKGKLAEQIAPLLPGFAYLPADARFLGDPVDYVVFNGYTDIKDNAGDGEDLEVVILDIKQGKSTLSQGQRRIAQAIEAGKVRFEVVRVFADGTVRSQRWGED